MLKFLQFMAGVLFALGCLMIAYGLFFDHPEKVVGGMLAAGSSLIALLISLDKYDV